MEPGNDQHISDRNNNVHIYTNIIRLCNNSNDGHYYQWNCYTNIHTTRATLSKRNSACIANNIKQ